MTNRLLKWATLVIAGLVLTACASTGKSQVEGGEDVSGYYGVETSSYNDPMYGKRGTQDRVIYFDFDSDRLRPESYNVARAHAEALKKSPSQGVWLDGHTDERGSAEYNLGLGERRAKAVRQVMTSDGVNPQQIRVRSYGKELPAVAGHDEGAWAQNRRVEIVY